MRKNGQTCTAWPYVGTGEGWREREREKEREHAFNARPFFGKQEYKHQHDQATCSDLRGTNHNRTQSRKGQCAFNHQPELETDISSDSHVRQNQQEVLRSPVFSPSSSGRSRT